MIRQSALKLLLAGMLDRSAFSCPQVKCSSHGACSGSGAICQWQYLHQQSNNSGRVVIVVIVVVAVFVKSLRILKEI